MNRAAILYALTSAALFGGSTPAAKVLLDSTHPVVLAGLFYCGAGIGVALLRRLGISTRVAGAAVVKLGRRDVPWLAGGVVCGGIIAPLLLMIGLTLTEAATASLLLTLETAATALMAWLIFHENVNFRVAFGMVLLVAGALVLAWSGTPSIGIIIGPLAIVGACVAWGFDNNLTRKVSHSDPMQIVEIKGLVAGPANLALALWAGGSMPAAPTLVIAMVVGFIGYGLGIVLFVLALRHLGSARTAAYFPTAPFLGTVAAVVALGEPITLRLVAAGCLIGLGIWLYLTERHDHEHVYELMAHSHPPHRHAHVRPLAEGSIIEDSVTFRTSR